MFSSMCSAHPMQHIFNNNMSIVSFQAPFWLSGPKLKEIQQVAQPVLSPAQCIIITFILPRCELASSIKHLGLRRDTKDYFEAHKWSDNHGRIRSKQNRVCNRRSQCFRSCVMLKQANEKGILLMRSFIVGEVEGTVLRLYLGSFVFSAMKCHKTCLFYLTTKNYFF